MDDDDEDLYPEGPLLEPDQRSFAERAGSFFIQYGFALFIVALVVVLVLVFVFGPKPEVTQANYEIIQVGMKEEDVATLLKSKATGTPLFPPPLPPIEGDTPVKVEWKDWSDGEGGRIIIAFVNGRVHFKQSEGTLQPR